MLSPFKFHHIGVAVPDLEKAANFYRTTLGFQLDSELIEDPIQKVKLCFLAGGGQPRLELISPMDGNSPVNGYLSKGVGAYHLCYEVAELAGALAALRARSCLVIGKPVPAVAFNGRKIAWCFTPTQQLVELLEQESGENSSISAT